MSASHFFLQVEKNEKNSEFLGSLQKYAEERSQQIYVIDRPLGDNRRTYDYTDQLIILSPGFKIILLNTCNDNDLFEDFVCDFTEDLASISDNFKYSSIIGRSRYWKDKLLEGVSRPLHELDDIDAFLCEFKLTDPKDKRSGELLISLLTGSINDVEHIKLDVPDNILDKVKQKIILFDGDQTRFIYQKPDKKLITIQGLSGTGKTELLLHKLKDLYISDNNSKIMFTCHSKILADSLRNRIPDFFNFMKVAEQIKWNERLWCVNAWGSQSNRNSGAYSYICDFYGLPFRSYSRSPSFEAACKNALYDLDSSLSVMNKSIEDVGYAFDYMLIDESQDFRDSFLELCSKVTKHNVYIAGDIFQSIFDAPISSEIRPDFLLSKCYRTDPRTLMFAHALGMGLFETPKLRWLEEEEWKACGYIVHKEKNDEVLKLTREPLRRFEDLVEAGVDSVEIVKTRRDNEEDAEIKIIEIIKRIIERHPSVTPNDIGVIFIDNKKNTYLSADKLEQSVPREIGWVVNKAYETKETRSEQLFISNRNNVKGLEFPFVICVTKKIEDSGSYRNSLYMMLTRSFISSYLLTSFDANGELLEELEKGLRRINSDGILEVSVPSEQERKRIKTTIRYERDSMSLRDLVYSIFEELSVRHEYRDTLYTIAHAHHKSGNGDEFDYDRIKEVIELNYRAMSR